MDVPIGVMFALISAFIWGTTTILARVFLKTGGGLLLNLLRLLISAPFYLPVLLIFGVPELTPFQILIIVLSSLSGFVVGDYFFFSSMKLMGVSRSVVIVTMYPLWVIALGHFWLGRVITVLTLIGAVLIILAVIIISVEKEEIQFNYLGVIYAFISQILWALAVVSIDWLLTGIPVLQVTGLRIVSGAMLISLALPWSTGVIKTLKRKDWVFVTLVAVLGTVVAQYTFTMAIKFAGSAIASPVAETSPLLATVLAKIFLKERVSSKLLLSIALMVAGVMVLML